MSKVQNVMSIKYAKATLQQLAQAETVNKTAGFYKPSGKNTYEEIVDHFVKEDGREMYPSYKTDGSLTLVGEAKRLMDLEKNGLNKNSTMEDFFKKLYSNTAEKVTKIIDDIETFHKNNPDFKTIGPKN